MMPVLVVALREYRQLTSTRSFWIMLLAIPSLIAFLLLLPAAFRQPAGAAFMVLDRTGRFTAAIDGRIEFEYQRTLLRTVTDYARHRHVTPRDPDSPWADKSAQWVNDSRVEAFVAAGGAEAALTEIAQSLPPTVAPPALPDRRFLHATLPEGAAGAAPDTFETLVRPNFSGNVATPIGPRPLILAVYIPLGIGEPGVKLQFWTNGHADLDLINTISGEVARELKREAMQSAGIAAAAADRIEALAPPMTMTAPPAGTTNRVAIRSVLPLALGYLLLVTIIVSGTMMLQSVIEERANKLLETVLACVSADQLLRGKLIGVGAVGLTIILVWVCFSIAGAMAMPGDLADALRPSLAVLQSPATVLCLIFYFFTGYLATSILFLAIGSMSDSMQDAQGYLMPLVLLLSGPFVALVTVVLENPNGTLPVVLSWIPLYTPFAMLVRLGAGVSPVEIAGTSALLLLFVVAEFAVLGRVFRASLLRTGQPPRLAALVRLALGR